MNFLKRVPCLSHLLPNEMREIALVLNSRKYTIGSVIIQEGQTVNSVAFLLIMRNPARPSIIALRDNASLGQMMKFWFILFLVKICNPFKYSSLIVMIGVRPCMCVSLVRAYYKSRTLTGHLTDHVWASPHRQGPV